jgi:hypothetical protein
MYETGFSPELATEITVMPLHHKPIYKVFQEE